MNTGSISLSGGRYADGEGGGGPGVNIDLTQVLTPGVILGLIVAVGVLLLIVGLAGWIALRRLRKNGKLEAGLLRAQAHGLPEGVARDAAELRLTLRDAIAAAGQQIRAAAAGDPTLADLPPLMARLEQEARALDHHLADLHPVPPSNGAEQLKALRGQATQLVASADQLRAAVRDVALSAASSAQLNADLNDTLQSLAARREALLELRADTPTTS